MVPLGPKTLKKNPTPKGTDCPKNSHFQDAASSWIPFVLSHTLRSFFFFFHPLFLQGQGGLQDLCNVT